MTQTAFGTSVDTQQWAQPVTAGVHGVSNKKSLYQLLFETHFSPSELAEVRLNIWSTTLFCLCLHFTTCRPSKEYQHQFVAG